MDRNTAMRLPDGRRISFADLGDKTGLPVVFFHGTPGGARLLHSDMTSALEESGIRLIVPARPGYGDSDSLPGRTIEMTVNDVSSLCDYLGLSEFKVIGYSLGGVSAIACSSLLGSRVAGLSLVGSYAPNPYDAEIFSRLPSSVANILSMARSEPESLAQIATSLAREPRRLYEMYEGGLSAADRQILASAELKLSIVNSCTDSLCNDGIGMVQDFLFASDNWGALLEAVKVPVTVWQGSADANVPPVMAEQLVRMLPHANLRFIPGAGHLCLYSHWEEILHAL